MSVKDFFRGGKTRGVFSTVAMGALAAAILKIELLKVKSKK